MSCPANVLLLKKSAGIGAANRHTPGLEGAYIAAVYLPLTVLDRLLDSVIRVRFRHARLGNVVTVFLRFGLTIS
jgi:hypothetical protein